MSPVRSRRSFSDAPGCLSAAFLLFALVGAGGNLSLTAAEIDTLSSPDGRIGISIRMPASGSTDRPRWTAVFRGERVLTDCGLGLETVEDGELLAGARVLERRTQAVNARIPVLFGKADHAADRFRETRFACESRGGHRVDVVFRCYNDAIAFRYEMPSRSQPTTVIITNEATSFHLEGDPTAFVQYLENFRTSHEHNVSTVPYRDLRRDALVDLPLTLAWGDRVYGAITEASLRHYAGMSLLRPSGQGDREGLTCQLTPRPDGTKVVRPLPLRTPWRVILLSDRLGALLESHTIYCLNEPSVIQDTSWIQPGKLTFHWWNGDVYDGQPGPPMLSFEMARKYIDFCARSGIPIHAITSTEGVTTPWYHQSTPGVAPGPDTDVIRPREGFDQAAIRRYAQSKNVRLWTWVHHAALRGRVEEAFAAFEKMGWGGMMVDFIDHDDQESVEWAESVLQAAARHHILIHFHGVWKPTGWQRTYPNLMNHEGALNLEYLKWSDRCTPEHDLMMAFTRLIAGPMDYHLGGFRAVPRARFAPRNIAPNVLGTRGHMLAMYVCFDNPTPMVADHPTAYEGQPGFDFVTMVPTWWDETRVLVGRMGELLVTARRKGATWYLGGLSAKGPRDVVLPLSFLGEGVHTVRIWKDAPEADADPNRLVTETLRLGPTDTLKVHVALDGGFVAQLAPEGEGR